MNLICALAFFSFLLYSQCLHCSCQNCLSLEALTLSPKHSTLAFHPIYLYILSIVVTHSAPQVQPVVCFFFVFQTIDHNVTCEHLGRQKLPNVICQPVHHHSMKELKVDPWCNLNPSVPSTSTLPFCPHTVPVLRHPHILLCHTWLPHKAFSRSRNTQCVSFRPPFYLSINTVVLSLLFIHQLLKVLPSSQHLATWLTQLAVIQLTSSICQSIPESSMTTSVWLLLII